MAAMPVEYLTAGKRSTQSRGRASTQYLGGLKGLQKQEEVDNSSSSWVVGQWPAANIKSTTGHTS